MQTPLARVSEGCYRPNCHPESALGVFVLMAGDWIKMRANLAEDPAVLEIAAITGLDRFAVVGRLHRIWAWADAHTEDGNATGVTLAFLNEVSGITGFAEAMVEAGWLETLDKVISFPKFGRHNGQSAKRRALATRRKQKERHATSVTETRPEKRREEKSSKFPTVQQCRDLAPSVPCSAECADAYHADRESLGWTTVKGGLQVDIVNWQSDMRKFASHWKEHRNRHNGNKATRVKL